MKLSSLMDPRLVRCGLQAATKHEALRELVELLVAQTHLTDAEGILRAVVERESLGTTAVGCASAFPHARTDAVDDFYMAIGTAPQGIDFGSSDGVPVRFVALLLITKTASKLYLKAIAALATMVQDTALFERLEAASDPEALIAEVEAAGIRVGQSLTLHDIMATELVTVRPETKLKEAVDLMFKHDVNALPVVDAQGRLVGALEHLDIVASGIPPYLAMIRDLSFLTDYEPFEEVLRTEGDVAVEGLMQRGVATVAADTPLIEAAAEMAKSRLERLYVVSDGRLVGLVLAKDFIRKILRG